MFRRLMAVLLTLVAVLAAGWLALRRPDIPFDTLEATYAAPDSQFLVLEGGEKVHYRDTGPADAPVLVLVHGFSASLHTWDAWVRLLDDEFRVVMLDLPGHGLTRGFQTDEIGIETFVETVDRLTASLSLDPFTLVGSSMGGNTAWNYTLAHPEKVDALVLVGASGWPRTAEDSRDRPFALSLLDNSLARSLVKDLDMTAMFRSGLEDSFSDDSLVTDTMVERYVALSRAPGHREALLRLMAEGDARGDATRAMLAAIEQPTLILQGREDRLVPPRFADAFAEAIPQSQKIVYDGVGHLPHEEIPRRSLSDLRAFLSDLQPERDPDPVDAGSEDLRTAAGDPADRANGG